MDARQKIGNSLAMLNALWSNPGEADASSGSTEVSESQPAAEATRKRKFMPPRPDVLDKIQKLTRPSPDDSIPSQSLGSPGSGSAVASKMIEAKLRDAKGSSVNSGSLTGNPYLPWSREQFHTRLATFKPSTWFDKPKIVSPVECARYGWVNTADDRLECSGCCGGIAIIKIDQADLTLLEVKDDELPFFEDGFDGEVSVEVLGPQFHAMLTSNHNTPCPWKEHPCDKDIYKFPVMSKSLATQEFLDRVGRLETMKDDPWIANVNHILGAEELEGLVQCFSQIAESRLLTLSLFGWDRKADMGSTNVLACQACHTQCTYTPDIFDDEDDFLGDEDTGLMLKGFNVVQSHKWFCYWITPQSASSSPGWKTLLGTLTKNLERRHDSSNSDKAATHQATTPRITPNDALARVRSILRGKC